MARSEPKDKVKEEAAATTEKKDSEATGHNDTTKPGNNQSQE